MRTLMSGSSASSGFEDRDLDLERALLAVHLRVELHHLRGVALVGIGVGNDLRVLAQVHARRGRPRRRRPRRAAPSGSPSGSARRSRRSRRAPPSRRPPSAWRGSRRRSARAAWCSRGSPATARSRPRAGRSAPGRHAAGSRARVELGLRGVVLARAARACAPASSACRSVFAFTTASRALALERGAVVAVVELDQRVAGLHAVRLVDEELLDPTGNARADRDVLVGGDHVAGAGQHRTRPARCRRPRSGSRRRPRPRAGRRAAQPGDRARPGARSRRRSPASQRGRERPARRRLGPGALRSMRSACSSSRRFRGDSRPFDCLRLAQRVDRSHARGARRGREAAEDADQRPPARAASSRSAGATRSWITFVVKVAAPKRDAAQQPVEMTSAEQPAAERADREREERRHHGLGEERDQDRGAREAERAQRADLRRARLHRRVHRVGRAEHRADRRPAPRARPR